MDYPFNGKGQRIADFIGEQLHAPTEEKTRKGI